MASELITELNQWASGNPLQVLYQKYIDDIRFHLDDFEQTLEVFHEENVTAPERAAVQTGVVGVYASVPSTPNPPGEAPGYQALPIYSQEAAPMGVATKWG